jgi:hypothetical protein
MAKSFTKKVIELQIILGQGDFGGAPGEAGVSGNTRTIMGLPVEAEIKKPGLPDKNSASIKVTNLRYEDMEQLTMLAFKPLELKKNMIRVRAGDDGGDLSVAFEGEISSASADFNTAPDVVMKFEAQSGIYPQLKAAGPVSVAGEASAAQLIEQQATEMGYKFENQGVSGSVRNAVFNGSPMKKAQDIAAQVGCEMIVDDGIIIIMKPGAARQGNAVLLTRDTGMIGYPTFNQDGIVCRCLYNPELQQGGLIKIDSLVPRASGTWKIVNLTHKWTAFKNGPWESNIEAHYVE